MKNSLAKTMTDLPSLSINSNPTLPTYHFRLKIATKGQHVVAEAGNFVRAEDGSVVFAKPGSRVRAKSGSKVVAWLKAEIHEESGATVVRLR